GTTGGWFDFGCANDDVDATFDDQGSSAVENVCNSSPGIGGTVIPHNALSAFNGESTQGVWTLKVEDKATITNSGTLNTWALETIIQ
ncbi:proprotein convertase P-domain-containing protein, partial [Oleiphilus sp. HI0043]